MSHPDSTPLCQPNMPACPTRRPTPDLVRGPGQADADPIPGHGGPEVIMGIAAAAEYLGYGKPDSFRRARTRTPIPGETRTPDGQPAWTSHALRDWHSKLKIAGSRAHTPGPD